MRFIYVLIYFELVMEKTMIVQTATKAACVFGTVFALYFVAELLGGSKSSTVRITPLAPAATPKAETGAKQAAALKAVIPPWEEDVEERKAEAAVSKMRADPDDNRAYVLDALSESIGDRVTIILADGRGIDVTVKEITPDFVIVRDSEHRVSQIYADEIMSVLI